MLWFSVRKASRGPNTHTIKVRDGGGGVTQVPHRVKIPAAPALPQEDTGQVGKKPQIQEQWPYPAPPRVLQKNRTLIMSSMNQFCILWSWFCDPIRFRAFRTVSSKK